MLRFEFIREVDIKPIWKTNEVYQETVTYHDIVSSVRYAASFSSPRYQPKTNGVKHFIDNITE